MMQWSVASLLKSENSIRDFESASGKPSQIVAVGKAIIDGPKVNTGAHVREKALKS